MRQCRRAGGSRLSGADKPVEVCKLTACEARLQHLQAAADAGQQVVEIVRHAARKLAERFKLLGLAQLIFRRL